MLLPLLVFCTTVFVYTQVILPAQEKRKDLVTLSDMVHDQLPFYDCREPINLFMAVSETLFAWEIFWYWSWYNIQFTLWFFSFLFLIRSVMLLLTPLKVPKQGVLLGDTFCKWIVTEEFQNDLFFSGHVSSLCAMYCSSHTNFAFIYGVMALLTAIAMLLSRVHYTIDVVVAPFVVYALHRWMELSNFP